MRLLLCFLLLAGTADAAPRFVVTKWQPGKKLTVKTVAPVINETPADATDVAPAPLDCGCAGDPSKCRCERGKCDCTHCKCDKCGEPKVEITPQMQAKLTALESDGVWWDENFLVESKKMVYGSAQTRRRIHVYTPSWCPACPKTKAALGDGDDELEVVYHTDERGVQGAKYYPAYWDGSKREFYYNVVLDANGKATKTPWIDNSLDNLKKAMGLTDPIVGSIQAGEIKRELIERVLPVFNMWHGAGLKGKARDIKLGSATVSLPENFGIDWVTSDGATTFQPTGTPFIRWSMLGFDVVNKKINFVKYDGEQIEFDISRMPNPILKIIGPKTMESILPNTPTLTKSTPVVFTDDVLPPPNVLRSLAATGDWSYPGDRRREDLINHMMDGQHAGRFSRSMLETMDLSTLEREHTRDHQRQYADVPKRVVRQQRRASWCPSGNCPNRG